MKETYIPTTNGRKLYVCEDKIDNPKGQIILIHGYTEHCRRYDKLVKKFNEVGFDVIRYDQKGYGKSDGKRAYISKFQEYNEDLQFIIEKTVQENIPVFLAGASMGGMVMARHLVKEGDGEIGGAIFLSPMLKIDDDISPLLQKVSGILGFLVPWLKTIKLESKFLSRDPEVEKAYLNDPLVYHKGAYARTASEMLKATRIIGKDLHKISCPILILHGTADKLTDPKGSKLLYESASSEDKSLKLFEGYYHELCNEPNSEEVFQVIQDWLRDESRILNAPIKRLYAGS